MKSSKRVSYSHRVLKTKPKRVSILGSTGSIGKSTLEIIRQFPTKFQIFGLSCIKSTDLLVNQIREFNPKFASVGSKKQALELKASFPETKFLWGKDGLSNISCDQEVDILVAGIVGAAGLEPTFSAVLNGKKIAFANKEPLVMAGELFVKTAKKSGAKLLPADSEHNAIFQLIHNEPSGTISKLFLTASGGPFRDRPLKEFKQITLSETLDHPNWKMGPKITVDSATMMNKGLEIIEARWLFNTPIENIEVVMHRESIIHSMVEFVDGSFLAQMGLPDMKIPIAYCLAWPERLNIKNPRMDPRNLKKLHFENIESKRFPCLQLCVKAAEKGGGAPAVLNGANEEVVSAFLNEKIKFLDIYKTLKIVMEKFENFLHTSKKENIPLFLSSIKTIEDAVQADEWGRDQAIKIIEQIQ